MPGAAVGSRHAYEVVCICRGVAGKTPAGGGPGLLSEVAVREVWIGYWDEFLQKKAD